MTQLSNQSAVAYAIVWAVLLPALMLGLRALQSARDQQRLRDEDFIGAPGLLAPRDKAPLAVGTVPGDFPATTAEGHRTRFSSFWRDGSVVVLLLSLDCEHCSLLLRRLAALSSRPWARLVVVSDAAVPRTAGWCEAHDCWQPWIVQRVLSGGLAGGDIHRAYNPQGLYPYFCVMEMDGRVSSRGPELACSSSRTIRIQSAEVATAGLACVVAVLGAVSPLLIRGIIDSGIENGNVSLVIVLGGALLAGAGIAGGVTLLQAWLSSQLSESMVASLRVRMYRHVLDFPVSFASRARTGAIASRMLNDVSSAPAQLTQLLTSITSCCLSVIVSFAAMLTLSWQLAVGSIVAIPLSAMCVGTQRKRLAQLRRDSMDLSADLATDIVESVSAPGALLIKLFGLRSLQVARIAEGSERLRKVSISAAVRMSFIYAGLSVLSGVGVAVIYGAGGVLAIKNHLSVGTIVAIAAYAAELIVIAVGFPDVLRNAVGLSVSFSRVFELLDVKLTLSEAKHPIRVRSPVAALRFVNVTFRYPADEDLPPSLVLTDRRYLGGGRDILSAVCFEARAGRTTAIVGTSGAGKTTIGSLAARLHDVTAGAVYLGETDVREISFDSLRTSIGVVSQDAHMFHDSLRANLTLGQNFEDAEIHRILGRVQASELVADLPDGLDTVLSDGGTRLSGGERQRVALARLLLRRPAVVVLDEATAHLDAINELAVLRAMREELQESVLVVITHRLTTISDADHIVVIDGGAVSAQGQHNVLMQESPLYRDLFGAVETAA